jgi:hypothetical protein
VPSQNWLADRGKALILPFSPTGEGTSLRRKLERDKPNARLLPLSPVGRDARESGSEGTGEDRSEGAATPNLKSLSDSWGLGVRM